MTGKSRRPKTTSAQSSGAITIADIAAIAGVSKMTVSRVITNPMRVGKETRERVAAIVKELNFSPNRAASLLSTGRQLHIGLLYHLPRSSYIVDFLVGAIDHASALDVQLVSKGFERESMAADELKRMLCGEIDALILTAPFCDSSSLLEIAGNSEIPILLVSTNNQQIEASTIFIDERAAAFAMTQHLINLGHERIGMIVGDPTVTASHQRLEGFKAALSDANLTFDTALVVQGDFTYRSGLSATEKLLRSELPPTAIFASNDDMAAAAVMTAHRLGFDVPDQLTVCGFDDSWIATMLYPELTTVRQPIQDMAATGISLLVNQVKKYQSGKRPTKRLSLDFELVIRKSDSPPSSAPAG